MKKEKLFRIFYILSIILLLAFIIILAIDHRLCYKCDPGYFFVLLFRRTYELLLPSLLSFIAGVFLKNRYRR